MSSRTVEHYFSKGDRVQVIIPDLNEFLEHGEVVKYGDPWVEVRMDSGKIKHLAPGALDLEPGEEP